MQQILNREKIFDLDEESHWKLMLLVPEIDNATFMVTHDENMKKATHWAQPSQPCQVKNNKYQIDFQDNL